MLNVIFNMKCPIICLAFLAVMGRVCSGLLVGPVRLAHNQRYINYQHGPSPQNSTIECPILLESETEKLSKVSWEFWKDYQKEGTFEWHPTGEAKATGMLEGVVNMEREDWFLELTSLQYGLLGQYSCTATLTNGKSEKAEKWEVMIIDTTSSHSSRWVNANWKTCVLETSYKAYTVFPEPTVHSGMYSKSLGGYYDELTASQWLKQIYPNGSVGYSYENRFFKINEDTPTDAIFLAVVAVTKSDGNYISLTSDKIINPIWTKRGCPAMRMEEYQTVTYSDCQSTCRGEYHTPNSTICKALVTCMKRSHADGEVKSLEFSCQADNNTWTAGNLQDEIKCVVDGSDPLNHDDHGDGNDAHDNDSDHDNNDDDGGSTTLPSLVLLVNTLFLARLFQ